jgi:16S rRNA processing protein RimM
MMSSRTTTLGSIVKTVGLKGEMKLLPGPDFWTGALDAGGLDLVSRDRRQRRVRVERYRAKGNTYILKLSGIESIEEAQPLVGGRLDIPEEMLSEAASPEQPLPFQVMEASVRLADGTEVGTVVDMLLGPVQRCLIVDDGERKFPVPVVPEVVVSIDLEKGIVVIDPPDGLLELEW